MVEAGNTGCFENNISCREACTELKDGRELQIAIALKSGAASRLRAELKRRSRDYAQRELRYFQERIEWHRSRLEFDLRTYEAEHFNVTWRKASLLESQACAQVCVEHLITLED